MSAPSSTSSSEPRPGDRRYLGVFLGVAGALSLGTAAVCVAVDPYDIWRAVSVAGVNGAKPQARFHDRLQKAWAIRHERPDALLLGTSRTLIGVPADSPVLGRFAQRPLNTGLPGGTPYEALRYLQHAEAQGPVKLAVLGLDLLMFAAASPKTNPEFREARLGVPGAPGLLAALRSDFAPAALSWDALRDTQRTLRRQGDGSYLDPAGNQSPGVQERSLAFHGGVRGVFLDTDKTYAGWLSCLHLSPPGADGAHFEDLRALFAFAVDRGIALQVFISPSHARHAELIRQAGRWGELEEFKRRVVRLAEEESARHPDQPPLQVVDFSLAAGPVAEPIPAAGERSAQMAGYWDSAHFKPALGERVLRRLLLGEAAEPGFGLALTAGNLGPSLALLESAQHRWSLLHPEHVAELQAVLAAGGHDDRARCVSSVALAP